ncbi:MAG: thiamine-phosphate kinase [Actinomycetota bacterium]|nr:thiamine-phosphate kinase [Actinomycetota bacterium]
MTGTFGDGSGGTGGRRGTNGGPHRSGGRSGQVPGPVGERAVVELLTRVLPASGPGETWIGDDAAVLVATGEAPLLLATDCVVEGVHVDRRYCALADVGWKALAVNVSDVAAMAGTPVAAVVAVSGAKADEVGPLYEGLVEAAREYRCPIVGGDLSAGPVLTLSVAVLGRADVPPVLRSGARAGDLLFVTGPLGRSAAGLRVLRSSAGRVGAEAEDLVAAHLRPRALLAHGLAAARAGATAMIDCSDGLSADLDRVAVASGVGVDLADVPVAPGATVEEALGGGEDYELVFSAPDGGRVLESFERAGLGAPVRIGRCVADPSRRTRGGAPLEVAGYEHTM